MRGKALAAAALLCAASQHVVVALPMPLQYGWKPETRAEAEQLLADAWQPNGKEQYLFGVETPPEFTEEEKQQLAWYYTESCKARNPRMGRACYIKEASDGT
jgi:hypothetical protein